MTDVASFQRLMRRVLATATDPEDVRHRLLAAPESEGFREWIERWEPRMIAVAIELEARWSVQRNT